MSEKFEAKMKAKREAKNKKIKSMPTIAMCEWEQYGDDPEIKGKMLYRSKVVKITKRSVTMRGINSDICLVTLSVPHGKIEDFVTKIEMMPCDTTEWAKPDAAMMKWLSEVE